MAAGDTLRQIYVLLGIKSDDKAIAKANASVDVLKGVMMGLAHEIESAGEKLFAMFEQVGKTAEQFQNLQQRTGIAATTLQTYAAIAKASGLDSEAFTMGLRGLAITMNKAADGSDEAGAAYAKLGVRTKDSSGKLRPLNDVLGDIADKFHTMPDGAQKLALAQQVLGKQGGSLIPILNKGSQGLAEMQKHIRDLGLVMDEDALKAAADFDDSMDDLNGSLEGLRNAIVGPLMKPLKGFIDSIWQWVAANREVIASGIQRFLTRVGIIINNVVKVAQPFVEAFLNFADTAAGSKVLFAGFIAVLLAIGAAFVVAAAAALSFAAAEIVAAAPILAAVAAVTALGAAIALLISDFYAYSKGSKHTIIGTLIDNFKELGSIIGDTTKHWFSATIDFWKAQFMGFFEFLATKFNALPGWMKTASIVGLNAVVPGASAGIALGAGVLGGMSGTSPAKTAVANGGGSSNRFQATFNIQTTPGMSPVDVGNASREAFDDWFSRKVGASYDSTVGQYSPVAGAG